MNSNTEFCTWDIIDVGNIEFDPSPIASYGVAVRNLDYQLTAKKRQDTSREVVMYHFATAFCAGIMATVIVGGTAFTPTRAEAAMTSGADTVALKETTTACKAEAKEKKISWPASRKFVSNCVAKTVKLTPAQFQEIAVKQATVACKAEAKGKKISWPASRKYVKNCITTALKERPHHEHQRSAQRGEL